MIKPYPKYKLSAISWLENIPFHWDISKIKYATKNFDSMRIPLSSSERADKLGEFPYYGATGVIDFLDEFIFDGEFILIGEDGAPFFTEYKDVCFLANGQFWVNNHCHILKSIGYDDRYICYWLNIVEYKNYINGSTRDKLTQSQLNNIPIPKLEIKEQKNIADFLDKKTKEIDQSISDKKQLIQLYEEEKQAIINNAVTKGLDNNAELKETGVEWLGSIPKHWKLTKIKYSSYLKARVGWKGLKSDEFLDDGYAYLVTGTDFKKGKIDWSDCHYIDKDRYEEDKFIQLQNNDLLITKDGTIGKLAIVENLDGYACLNSGVFVMRPLDSMYQVKFLYYILSSKIFESFIDYTSTGATILHLYQNVFNEFQYPLPTVKEQNEIIGFIEKSLTKVIDKQLAIEKEIELLKEYKQALIYEAVTGKIDVRDKITD